MRRTSFLSVTVLILLAAALLRFHAAAYERRFHPDEALFSTFARHAAVNGDWMLQGELDKPPLYLYASAVSMVLFAVHMNDAGVLDVSYLQGEFAARLPNAFAGVVVVALVIILALRLYRDEWLALWAGILAALSPLMIGFSAAAFTDMMMLVFALLGVWLAARGRWLGAGAALALAFAAKQQGLIYLPLTLILGWAINGFSFASLAGVFAPLVAMVGAVTAWDAARRPVDSIWALAAAHNLPEEVSISVGVRRVAASIPAVFGAPTAIFLVLIPVSVIWRGMKFHNRRSLIDALLIMFIFAVVMLHLALGLNWYDRYTLLLIPPACLLAARAGTWIYMIISARLTSTEARIAVVALLIALLVSAGEAANFRFGYGDSYTSFPDNSGIEQVAAYLNEQPVAAVIYDHWINWLLGYYLGEWNDKRRVYYPEPDALVWDALALDECQPRFLPVPPGISADIWLQALENAGFDVSLEFQRQGWRVYTLTPPPNRGAGAECAGFASPD